MPDPEENMVGVQRGRGGGWRFGADVTTAFLDRNKLDLLVRSHEVCQKGFEVMQNNRLITVFSAPNYCGSVGNLGAVLKVNGVVEGDKHIDTLSIVQFSAHSKSI